MFHALDILRINCFIVHERLQKEHDINYRRDHRQFVMNFVTALQKRAQRSRTNANANVYANANANAYATTQTAVYSRKDSDKDLPTCRFKPGHHTLTFLMDSKNRATCEWCNYEIAVAKRDKVELPRKTAVKTTKYCSHCGPNYRLSRYHFDVWHTDQLTY